MYPLVRPRLLIVLLGTCLGATPAWAADLRVTTEADAFDGVCDSHCSLRDAVSTANGLSDPQRILLPAGVYRLDLPAPRDEAGEDGNLNGDLDVTGELLIQGVGADLSRISGLYERNLSLGNDRLFDVLPGARLTLLRLTLEKGSTPGNGGAVLNHGTLSLQQVAVQGNNASTENPDYQELPGELGYRSGQGGGIANYGDLVVLSSSFTSNRSWGYGDNNLGRGGAIFNRGSLLVRDSSFSRNLAADDSERSAGGAVYNGGLADIARSAFIANSGSEGGRGFAIANDDNGQLKLSNSTLSGHYGTGGALSNGYYSNPADNQPKALLVHVTIAGNSGYGVRNSGDLLIRNSLIAGNLGVYEDEVTNCRNEGPRYRYRAIGLLRNDEPSNCGADIFVPFDDSFTQLLEPLANNGGLTPTYALRPGSPALDAAVGSCSSHDQRRAPRPQDGTGDGVAACDLGAYELNPD